jgi:hypothetical protein
VTPDELDSTALRREVAELVHNVELVSVDVVSLAAQRHSALSAVEKIQSEMTSNCLMEDGLSYRYGYDFELSGEDQRPAATIAFEIELRYVVATGFKPTAAAVVKFGEVTGAFAAHPYARELLQSLAGRIGFGSVVLPLLKRSLVVDPSSSGESSP